METLKIYVSDTVRVLDIVQQMVADVIIRVIKFISVKLSEFLEAIIERLDDGRAPPTDEVAVGRKEAKKKAV